MKKALSKNRIMFYLQVTTSYVHVVNNIMNVNEEELFDAQEQSNSPSRLVQGLEKQLGYLKVNSSRGFDEKFDNIAVKVILFFPFSLASILDL